MKKTDIAMIILIATASVLIAFFATRAVLGGTATEIVQVDTIEKIKSDVVEPDPDIFNADAINPAVEVQIDGKSQ